MADQTASLAALGLTAKSGREARITGLAVDSRAVQGGFLFAALPGTAAHGAQFVPQALRQGAAAILTDPEGARLAQAALARSDAALVIAEDARAALAWAAALWFRDQPKTVVAVTGTNGKTSVATFTRQIWMALGHAAISIGTTGVEGAWDAPSGHTTPEPVTLHRLLADAARAGVTHAAMEASSHGLDQRRLDGVRLTAAAFTNFTQDHLDYHGTFEAYGEAKARLFDMPGLGDRVFNVDDGFGARLAKSFAGRGRSWLTCRTAAGRAAAAGCLALDPGAKLLAATAVRRSARGLAFEIEVPAGSDRASPRVIEAPLVGDFNMTTCSLCSRRCSRSRCRPRPPSRRLRG